MTARSADGSVAECRRNVPDRVAAPISGMRVQACEGTIEADYVAAYRFDQKRRKGTFVIQWYDRLVQFVKSEDGQTAVEYAVMLALIIVVCIGAITTLGGNANKTFTSVGSVVGGS